MADTSPQPNVTAHGRAFMYPVKFWMLVVVSGVGAGLAGGLLMRLLRAIEHLAYLYPRGDFLSGVAGVSPYRRVGMLLGAGIIATLIAYLSPRMIETKPVGLSKAIWFRSGRLPFGPTLVHALESIVIVGMGVSLGREGALKDTGAAIASKLSDWFGVPADQRRLLVACAAGAGMAAAYNIPFGGALFAVEVLMGTLSFSMVLPALATSMIATSVSWLFLPNQPAYDVPAYVFQLPDLGWAILAAPIFGLASVFWVRAIGWAEIRKPKGWQIAVFPIVGFTAIGVVSIWFPDILGNGKGLVQRAYVNQLGLESLLPLLVLRFLATATCLATGAPGGVFTPTMTYGALLGGGLGRLWAFIVPGSDVGVFAAIGSAAVLAVATQGPISSIVMVMELTHHIDAIMVPLLVATVGASVVAHRLEPQSLYTAPIHSGAGVVVLPKTKIFGEEGASDYVVLSSAAPYARVAQALLGEASYCFVVDDEGELLGALSREDMAANLPLTPLDGVTAADLALTVPSLLSSASPEEVRLILAAGGTHPVPVLDPKTSKLIGAVRPPRVRSPDLD